MNEETKAVEEVAKTTGKAIDASRELGGFLARFIDGPLEQAMGIVEDKLKYQRWERQVRLMDRAKHFLKGRGLSQPTRAVPLQIAIPLMQGGSLEENDALQDRWALLLVNAADGAADVEVRRAFISILEDLTAPDALILDKIYSIELDYEADLDTFLDIGIWTTFLPERVELEKPSEPNLTSAAEVRVSIANLARLGLVTTAMAWGGVAISDCVHQTVLGKKFLRACTPNSSDA